ESDRSAPDPAGLRPGRALLGLSDPDHPRGGVFAGAPAAEGRTRGRGRAIAPPALPLAQAACATHGGAMSRRKTSHQSHGTAHRPRFWGRHAVAAALDNPDRKVLRAWATRDAAAAMQFPKEVAVTLADVADLGRLVPHDAPHQGVVVEVDPLEEPWLGDILQTAAERSILLVLD